MALPLDEEVRVLVRDFVRRRADVSWFEFVVLVVEEEVSLDVGDVDSEEELDLKIALRRTRNGWSGKTC